MIAHKNFQGMNEILMTSQLYTTNQLMASPRRFTATGSGIIKITWQKLLSVVKHFGI